MKKLFLLFSIFLVTAITAQAQKYPFGAATVSTLTVNNDTLTPTVSNSVTYITGSDTLIANTVMYATTSSSVKAGDQLYLRLKNGSTVRTITFKNTYFVSPVVTGTASKTKLIHFVYDGTYWVYLSSNNID